MSSASRPTSASKPVLIGTAVVGATTMIFTTIVALTNGLTTNLDKLSLLHAPFLLGLITGGAVIYWFTGAYRAVEIRTQYAQKGMLNIFLVVFFSTLAFAFLEPFYFIGYLMSIPADLDGLRLPQLLRHAD
jgi:K(+)-stimulated pyrophosphate-energized sodium pump